MKTIDLNRNVAIVVGILFILREVTSITGLILYGPILNDPEYIINGAADEARVIWGAFFEVLLVFTQIGTAITLFPILKKYNESMAIGTVCFRLMEATIVILGIMSLLAIVTLNHSFLKEANPDTSSYLMAGKLLLDIHNWTFLYGPNLILGPSTFMTSYLLYKSKLVPRFVTFLGLVGGPLISANAVLVMFGVFPQLSVWGMVLAIPVFAYEVSLAVRLLANGFNSVPVAYVPVQNLFKLAGRQV
jgi:hypothetical protein